MPGFGKSGPWMNYTGFAFNLEQLSGIAHHTGFADGPPSNIGAAADPIMGMYGAFAVLAALEARHATGQGQFIDLAHIEAMTAFSAAPILEYQLNGRVPMRTGNQHPTAAPHNFYPCKGTDQWVAIACYSEDDWRRLVAAMGNPAWAADTRYADELSRWKHQDELDRRIGEWTAGLDKHEAMRRLQEAGIAAGAAANAVDLLADRHLNARRMQQELDHPFAGRKPYPRLPYLIDGEPLRWAAAAPTVGQHNAAILRGLLGVTEREFQRLEKDKIIGYGPLGVEGASK